MQIHESPAYQTLNAGWGLLLYVFVAPIPILCILRNDIVKRWVDRKDFSFLYTIETYASFFQDILFSVYFIVFLISASVMSTLTHGYLGSSTQGALAFYTVLTVAPLVTGMGSYSAIFKEMFPDGIFASICLQNYCDAARRHLGDRRQLMVGLKLLIRYLERRGIRVSYHRLALAFDVCLVADWGFFEQVNSIVGVLRGEGNASEVFDAVTQLLRVAKESERIGIEVPYSGWSRFLLPPMSELSRTLFTFLSALITLISTIILLLARFYVS
jgi:hypothetical protein